MALRPRPWWGVGLGNTLGGALIIVAQGIVARGALLADVGVKLLAWSCNDGRSEQELLAESRILVGSISAIVNAKPIGVSELSELTKRLVRLNIVASGTQFPKNNPQLFRRLAFTRAMLTALTRRQKAAVYGGVNPLALAASRLKKFGRSALNEDDIDSMLDIFASLAATHNTPPHTGESP